MNPTQPSFRRCTPSTASDGAVKYRGVRKREWGKWVSEIRLPHSRERIWLGSYDSAEKAARAFDAAMYCLRGRDTAAGARFNFPDRIPDHIPRARELSATEIQAVAAEYANNEPQQGTEQGDTRRTVGVDGAAVGGHLGHQEQVHHLASPEGLSPGLSGITHDGTFGDVFDIGWPFPEFHQGSTVDAVDQGFCSSPLMGGDFLPPLESPFHYPCSPEDGSDGSSRGSDIGILPAACQRTSFLWNF